MKTGAFVGVHTAAGVVAAVGSAADAKAPIARFAASKPGSARHTQARR
jgi:hypothetical protein